MGNILRAIGWFNDASMNQTDVESQLKFQKQMISLYTQGAVGGAVQGATRAGGVPQQQQMFWTPIYRFAYDHVYSLALLSLAVASLSAFLMPPGVQKTLLLASGLFFFFFTVSLASIYFRASKFTQLGNTASLQRFDSPFFLFLFSMVLCIISTVFISAI